ncbi:hypothetical protein CANCADRAFT_124711 [Tortispora caseinolytica NRRL Y-17796]|uniref:Major facilitator superfamily (MFS) profile domain-containing protein n=1 Tax=Tortispora caseinolytica NRRL Y-17796 TaxID=767744 RepID=A0A1E4TA29_9ASCO|nr:hypothetical protein CANCADRAFT_124711 [Tortispora caseinolytica NRRL Y-17796]
MSVSSSPRKSEEKVFVENIERGDEEVRVNDPEVRALWDEYQALQEQFGEVGEAKLIRKVDWRLIPVFAILYLIAFLDRGNIGNARLAGLEEDLNMTADQYNIALTVFFFPYALFEIPSNIILKVLRPRIWLSVNIFIWGVVMTCMGVVQGYGGLIATRVLLGVFESSFFPGVVSIISMWYKRHEMQFRVSLFYASASFAGAFSGLLAYAISQMSGIAGLLGWRWIFILEGIVTVIFGAASYWMLCDDPRRTRWLTSDEIRLLQLRCMFDVDHIRNAEGKIDLDSLAKQEHGEFGTSGFKWDYLWTALKDWKMWNNSLMFWGCSVTTYAFSFSVPTIMTQLGYSNTIAQLMTIPVYIAAAIMTIVTAYFSDRFKQRAYFVIGWFATSVVGIIIQLATKPHQTGPRFFALFLIAMGIYSAFPGVIALHSNNLPRPWIRAVSTGCHICFGNLGGAVGSNIFIASQRPVYQLGYGFVLGITTVGMITATIDLVIFKRINAKREKMNKAEILAKYTNDELEQMGEHSPLFRYTT